MDNLINDLTKELGQNFIEYAVAVNTDRAIPDAKSGLKPVAKRILYAAFDGGHFSSKPHVKSAAIVGDTMGKWHPHGDSSIYGAMVRLAQPWTLRYPLIDWHGNMGNQDGDGPAAPRYTEARLSKLSEDGLLAGIKKNNVDFMPNYSETDEEPVTLPALFPNLLCNPNTGIGVAMACNWLPHNLKEVAQAIYDYLDGKEPTIPGPDFPTGGLIINKDELPSIVSSGRGSVKLRGKYKIENKNTLVFYELPYGILTENLLNEIGEVTDNGTIEGIVDIRNESNKKGLRVVVQCAAGVNPDKIAMQLFQETNLQTSISYNQVALIDKTPTELTLKDCLKIYVEHNTECIRREAEFDLQKVRDKLEIVEGLLKALEDIDNIIALIKTSESAAAAKVALMSKYLFTEPQAKAIVDMKLGKLAGLEKIEIYKEQQDLIATEERLTDILLDLPKELRTRLIKLVEKYGDSRRTELAQIAIEKKEKEIEAIVPEECVVIVTQNNYIKRVPLKSFKVQKRAGAGIKTNNEITLFSCKTNTIDTLMVFSSKGKVYRILVDKIPEGTNATHGVSITNLIQLGAKEEPVAYASLYRNSSAKYIFFVTKNGLIKRVPIEEYTKSNRTAGLAAIGLREGDSLAAVTFIEEEEMILTTKEGNLIRFKTAEMPISSRIAQGVKGIALGKDDYVISCSPIKHDTDNFAIITEDGLGKKVPLTELPTQGRGGKGVRGCAKENKIAGVCLVEDKDNVLIIGEKSSICISAKDIPLLNNRTSVGNILLKNNKVLSINKI